MSASGTCNDAIVGRQKAVCPRLLGERKMERVGCAEALRGQDRGPSNGGLAWFDTF